MVSKSDGFGRTFSQGRSWTNLTQYDTSGGRNGTGMVGVDLPSLKQTTSSTTLTVVLGPNDVRQFALVSGQYVSQSFLGGTLAADNGEFVYADTLGGQARFYGFDSAVPANQRGQLKQLTDAGGTVTYVSAHTTGGDVAEIRRKDAAGADGESWLYTYLSAEDANAGMLANVQLRRPDGSGGWAVVRQVDYAYYEGTVAAGTAMNGSWGDLKTATIKDGAGNALETKYYRYYVYGEANGYAHGLKYALDAEAFARLAANIADPFTATDAQVAGYATHYFQYDNQRRVTLHAIPGFGSSVNGGIGTFHYAYSDSTNAEGVNAWSYKTVETLPDGNQNVVYCNALGEVMLKVFKDLSDPANPGLEGKQWATFYKYDAQGRILWEAEPSAVTGYDETKADLLDAQGGNYTYLADGAGLIHVTDYYAATTATDTTAGGAAGYVQARKLRHGELGATALLEGQDYFAHSGGGNTVYPEASHAIYRNADGTGGQTTSYAYAWYAGSTQVQSRTTTLPVVSAAQNGSGVAGVMTDVFDRYGRVVWTRDAGGFLGYVGYDTATGAVTRTIQDVDTTETTDFADLPSGWATPAGGGLHLLTAIQVDGLGRPTRVTDASGNVTYTTYNDAAHEARTYRGWDAANHVPTGPTEVARVDYARGYTELLTMSAAPALAGGLPTGAEAVAGVQSLRRDYTNAGGQLVRSDRYFDLSGLTYSAAAYLGAAGTNYYSTAYAYDDHGQQSRLVNAVGTITVTRFDGQGRPTAVYVGTNDSTTDGLPWTPANAGPSSNMLQIGAYEYDGNDVGDGNLTRATSLPDADAAHARVTVSNYDWRDRLVATKSGVQATEDAATNRPLTVSAFDNLGQVTAVSVYDADGLSMADADRDGIPNALDSATLRARTTSAYDDLGRVFQTTAYVIDQGTGVQSPTGLTTDQWYDARGDVAKTRHPGGLVDKFRYDGAGRVTASYQTDGGGDTTYADALNVTGDAVLRQVETQYSANGLPLLVTMRERFDGESATGALGDATTAPHARVSYVDHAYDAANRLFAVIDVGMNGGTPYAPPITGLPARSDTVLLTTTTFDAAGRPDTVTDPRGLVTKTTYDALGRVTSTLANFTNGVPGDDANRTTNFTYDGSDHVLTQTLVQSGGRPNQTTQYVYGVTASVFSNDLLAAVEHPDPTTGTPSATIRETFTYDRLGEALTTTSPNGAVQGSAFDVLGRLRSQTTTTDGSGNPTIQFGYDVLGNVSSVTDARSHTANTVYDSLGRKLRDVLPDPGDLSGAPTTTYAYDAAGNLSAVTDPRGNTTAYAYDLLGRKTQTTAPDPDGAGALTSPVTTFHYNVGADRNTTTDARGNAAGANPALHTTAEVFDRFGRRVELVQPSPDGVAAQPTITYAYDRDGNLVAVTDPRGSTTTYTYDGLNRRTSETLPDPDGSEPQSSAVTQYAYDAVGNLVQVTDPLGHATDYHYDALNRKTEELLPPPAALASRPTTANAYDDSGNLTSVTDPLGRTTDYDYDQLGRRTQETKPAPEALSARPTVTYAYDLANNLTAVTDELGRTTAYAYDNLNRRTSETLPDPDGAGSQQPSVTQYGYDAAGNQTSTTDPLGQVAQYAFDALNRKTAETLPDPDGAGALASPVTTFAYDANGNLLSQTDPAGNVTSYTYDNLDRLLTDATTAPQGTVTRARTYDAAGNLLTVTDRNGRVRQFTYDALNRQLTEEWLDAGSQVVRTITSAYDAKGRLTSITDPDSSYAYTYDDLDRVLTVDNDGTPDLPHVVLSFEYDAAGRRTAASATLDGTADYTNAYTYDDLDRLTRVTQSGTGVSAKRVDFAYRADGSYDSITRYADLAGTSLAATTAYGYDDAGRLTDLTHSRGGTTLADYAWAFDADGRLTSYTDSDGTAAYAYDSNGQLTAADNSARADEAYTYDANGNRTTAGYDTGADNRLLSDGAYDYEYDDEGNRTKRTDVATGDVVEYEWDYRNRLAGLTFKDGTGAVTKRVAYTYDALDRRIGKRIDADADGTYETAERYALDGDDLALVFDDATNVQQRYLYGSGTDQVLAEEDGAGSVRWMLADHQGSVRDVVDSAGTSLDHVVYDGFGNVVSQTSAANAPRFGYTGREQDPESGLNYYRRRYYDPAVGRFLSQDPIGFGGGDANLYRYVGNSTPNRTDPSGLSAQENSEASGEDWSEGQASAVDGQDQRQRAEAYAQLKHVTGLIERGYLTDPDGATALLTTVRAKLLEAGFPRDKVDEVLAPYVQYAVQRGSAKLEANRWYTSEERFQGSQEIVANKLSFGLTDKLKFTDTSKFHGPTFVGAHIGASVAQFGEVALAGQGVFSGLGAVAAGGGALGTAAAGAQVGLVAYGGFQSGMQIGNGARNLAKGNYSQGASELYMGGVGAAMTLVGGTQIKLPGAQTAPAAAFEVVPVKPGVSASGLSGGLRVLEVEAPGGFPSAPRFVAGEAPSVYTVPAETPGLSVQLRVTAGPLEAAPSTPAPLTAADDLGVIYLRTDAAGGLKPYVGRSISWERYLARQGEHLADFPDSFFQFQELGRAAPGPALDVAEENWIRQLGGPTNKSNPGGLLSNKRYQMNDVRYRAAGGTVGKP